VKRAGQAPPAAASATPVEDAAVPLTLLTGFLGAGKTTLVNRVLSGATGEPVAVLVNDFGAINIDRELIADESAGVLSLQNGCICCSLRDDLVGSVMRLLDEPGAPRRVLLEASGIADPVPIAATFMAPAFRHRLRLDGSICVVDAEQALTDPELAALQLRQIGCSDLVLLNKTDLAGPERTAELRARIRAEFAGARLYEAVYCEAPPEILFSADGPARLESGANGNTAHADHFAAWSTEMRGVFDGDALYELARRLPVDVYRAKGIVRVAGRGGQPDRRGVLQVVGRRADLVAGSPWPAGDPPSRLVFIGAAGRMQVRELEALLTDCLAARAH
jgi:G3E family GTPase